MPGRRRFRSAVGSARLAAWARRVLGMIFILASIDKLLEPALFAEAILNYQVLPLSLVNLAAIVLPWLELFLGLSLLAGWWLKGSVFLVNLLLLAFVAALGFNLARGLDIQCGCFTSAGGPITLWTFLRDLAFLALGAWAAVEVFTAESTALEKEAGQ